MRREGPQVYFFRTIYKREPYDEEAMSCKNKIQIDTEDPFRGDNQVPLVKITGFPEVMAYLPGKVGDAVVEGDAIEFNHEQEAIGRDNWFEFDSHYDPTLSRNHRSGFTARRICRATVLLDCGLMGRNGMGIPSKLTLAMGIEEDSKKMQQRGEDDRREKIDWWSRYAQLPAWGVTAGVSGSLLQQAVTGNNE